MSLLVWLNYVLEFLNWVEGCRLSMESINPSSSLSWQKSKPLLSQIRFALRLESCVYFPAYRPWSYLGGVLGNVSTICYRNMLHLQYNLSQENMYCRLVMFTYTLKMPL